MTYERLMTLFRAADAAADQRNAGVITEQEYRTVWDAYETAAHEYIAEHPTSAPGSP